MVYGAIDLHLRYSQIRVIDEAGRVLRERRVVTSRAVLVEAFSGLGPIRVLLETGTESECVDQPLRRFSLILDEARCRGKARCHDGAGGRKRRIRRLRLAERPFQPRDCRRFAGHPHAVFSLFPSAADTKAAAGAR
jgi:hypothetical protein